MEAQGSEGNTWKTTALPQAPPFAHGVAEARRHPGCCQRHHPRAIYCPPTLLLVALLFVQLDIIQVSSLWGNFQVGFIPLYTERVTP